MEGVDNGRFFNNIFMYMGFICNSNYFRDSYIKSPFYRVGAYFNYSISVICKDDLAESNRPFINFSAVSEVG